MLPLPRHLLALGVVVACVVGCDSPERTSSDAPATIPTGDDAAATRPAGAEHPQPPAIVDPRPAREADLDEAMAQHGMITFRSHGATWSGGGTDADLTYRPGHRVELRQYGCFELRQSVGSYSIDENGILTARFDPGVDWPPMFLLRDRTSLILLPQDEGKTPSKEVEGFWAFRPLPSEEQANFKTRL